MSNLVRDTKLFCTHCLGYAKEKGAFYFVVMWKPSSSTALETKAAPLHNNVRAELKSCEYQTVEFKTTCKR